MRGRASAVTMLLAAATIGVSSCGGGGGQPDPTPQPAGAVPFEGTYAKTITEADLTETAGAEPGEWTLTIGRDDAAFDGPRGRIPLDPISLSRRRIVVPPDPNCPNNRPRPGKGVYEVEWSGTTLDFKKVRDPCGDRAFTFTVHEWRRRG